MDIKGLAFAIHFHVGVFSISVNPWSISAHVPELRMRDTDREKALIISSMASTEGIPFLVPSVSSFSLEKPNVGMFTWYLLRRGILSGLRLLGQEVYMSG